MLTVSPSSGAPASPGDNWKIVFDSGTDLPYNYSTSFKPEVWLYDQAGTPVLSGVTLSYNYVNVNTGGTIASGTATNNGDGSYTGGSINMPSYAGNYINIKFSVPQNSNILSEQHVVFAGTIEASRGAVWKIVPLNTSYGPSWDRTLEHKVFIILFSDAGVTTKNVQENPTINIKNSAGSIVNSGTMSYLADGIYNYSLPANTITSDGEYYFEISNRWSSRIVTGGNTRYTTAIAGFNIEAVANMGDTAVPDIINMKQTPNIPAPIDNVTLNADVLDNINISYVIAYYTVNNGSLRSIPMLNGLFTYSGNIGSYLMEDHIRYWISAGDGVNALNSSIKEYVVGEPAGSPNASFSYLNHPVYYFGYSRAGTTNDAGGDTNYDGTWTTGEKDGVYYMQANPQVYAFFRDMTAIKIKTLVLDSKGKPVRGLKNVKAWLQANKTQAPGARNANKTMTEIEGEDGVYTATWEGSPAMNGNSVTWNNDARVIWGKYDSGQIYSVYVDINNDSVAEENVTWLAYNFLDTYVGSAQDGKGLHGSNIESSNTCSRACHQGMIGSTSRIDAEPTCPDCHGVEKTANGGSWPISGNTAATDKILYGNSSTHSRLNTSGNKTFCGDESCHNSPWGTTPVDPAPIPGYNAGDPFDKMFNNSGYPVPALCGECHNYRNRTVPSVNGHNAMIDCKFCHGSYHRQHKLNDYNITQVKDDVIRGTPGYVGTGGENGSGKYAGNCYKDCHKTQVEHSLLGRWGNQVNEIVPCDECHKNFNNASMHLEDVRSYDDRNTCGGCHQAGTGTHNKSFSMNPPIVTNPVRHSENIIGDKWNRTGTRPYWAEYESSCRYCHNRSYSDAYGLGRPRDYKGNNIINGTINSTSFWCASCHVDAYRSGNNTFIDMVRTYNDSYGVVPPEITGNTTWMSDRSGYFDHQSLNYINDSNSSSYSDHACYVCHGSNSSSMTAFMHNVTQGSSGNDCLGCHISQKGQYPGINTSAFGKHENVNTIGGQNNLTNNDCTTCHYDTSVMNNVKTLACANCHTQGNYSAMIIKNHRQNATNITTPANCFDCHNNSISYFAYDANSSASHYTTNTSLIDTTNCTWCHKNSINGTKWGNALDPWNSATFPHSINSTPREDCYSCHGNVASSTFHNSTLVKPGIGTVTCLDCHMTNRTMALKEIDAGVIGTGVHKNRACENCHVNATDTNMDGTYLFSSDAAKTCTFCHTGSGRYNATLIKEHNQAGQDIITAAQCTTCHDNSGMYLANTGTNGTGTAISHYVKDITNISAVPYQHFGPINTTNCLNCHNGPNTSNPVWGSPTNISTSSKRQHTETTNSQCDTCHKDNNISSLSLVDFHNASLKQADSTDCISCHTSVQRGYPAINLSSFTRHKNVNATGGQNTLTNDDCTTCHYNFNYSVMNQTGFTTPTRACDNCHASTIKNHVPGTANISTASYCSDCHNNSISKYAYSENASVGHYETNTSLIDTTNCTWCHKNSINGSIWGNALDPWNSATFPHSINSTPREDCYSCHGNVASSTFHNSTLVKPALSTVTCLDCHMTNRTMSLKEIDAGVIGTGVHKNRACENCHVNATDTNMDGTYLFSSDAAKTCTFCHTGSGRYNATLIKEHNQAGQDVITAAQCTTCHDNSGMYLANTGTNGTGTAISHYVKDITNISAVPYQHFGPINTTNCLNCHNGPNTSNPVWGSPTNISTSSKRQHTETTNSQCDTCHKDNNISSLSLVDFHNASLKQAESNDCLSCHTQPQGSYPAINTGLFGKHSNVNVTGGQDTLTNDDCATCHYNFNISLMYAPGNQTPVRACDDCHKDGSYQAPIINNHRPPNTSIIPGGTIGTNEYCSTCHINSIGEYNFDENASVSHYGTTSSLVRTVNQTTLPRYGFFSAAEASAYNTECNTCHNPPNMSYGSPTNITYGHTRTAACSQCHVNAVSDDFHNSSLGLPLSFSCVECHKTYADKYNAPNLTGTGHNNYDCATSCHPPMVDYAPAGQLGLQDHNQDWTWTTTSYPTTGSVYLNGAASLTVPKGTVVTITSNISDDYTSAKKASRVRGAEYYIDTDPGIGKGTFMEAADGRFDAVNGNSENIIGTIDTSTLSPGTHTVYVRGMDIGKLWSTTKTATITIEAIGYINGTVTDGVSPLAGVLVFTTGASYTTGTDGKYSLKLEAYNYTVIARKSPTHYDNMTEGVKVTPLNTTILNITMIEKPKGTITGMVAKN